MKKKKGKIKKIFIIIAILVMNALGLANAVYATNSIHSAYIYSIGSCGQLLKYKGSIVKTDYVQYSYNGVEYPAYCMDKTKVGAQVEPYTVSVQEAIKDIGLWKVIINGYPYKSIEELEVINKEEAFTATKQAVYCYIHGNRLEDYEGIGEAGNRTLRALYKIVNNAQNSNETKISSTIQINKIDSQWQLDDLNPKYISKTYSVKAGAGMKNYKIQLIKENAQDIGGIKITDIQNIEKNEFSANEKFKVLIPIKEMTQEGSFKLTVESQVETKPILYGVAPNSKYQDYALTSATYEDGTGETTDEYPKNETKIIVVKKDEETKEPLEGVEFELLNENKDVIYSDLKTDSEGKIEIHNLVPGTYYLREVQSKEGYEKYEKFIEIKIALHEEYTVNIYNRKEEKPKIEIEKKENHKEVKKLPVTGM